MFGVLRHRAFRWIWIGALVSNVGNWISCGALAVFSTWSASVREPAIDAMELPPPPPRGFRAALWEALTAASHRAQVGEPRAAEPLEE